jgi:hypothetical protein
MLYKHKQNGSTIGGKQYDLLSKVAQGFYEPVEETATKTKLAADKAPTKGKAKK